VLDELLNQIKSLFAIIPALLKAGAIFLIGVILAKILAKVVERVFQAIGLDKLAKKLSEVDLIRNSRFDIIPSKIGAAIIYYLTIIVFLMATVEALGMKVISDMMVSTIAYIPNAITAFVVLLIGVFIADSIKKVVAAACRGLGISAGNLIASIVFYFILLNIILIALRQAQLQTEFMEDNISIIVAGVVGAFAIGYGLASRHLMGSILASFYNRGRIRVGDEISVEGKRGEVITINNNALTLRGEDSDFIIPFSKVASEGVEIHSRPDAGPALPPHEEGRK
jgi:hypothetical protein